MNEFANLRERLPGILRALAIGVPAGWLFHRLHTPIPWMLGPMIAVAAVNLLGVRVHSVPFGRQMGQVVLGSAVALYFTPPVVAALADHIGAIVVATFSAFLIGGLGALTMSRASGVDRRSAFFASIPGGSMAMAVLAQRYGASIPPVAVTHSLRVSLVIIVVPFALTYGGIPLEAAAYRPQLPLDLPVLAAWLAFGFLVGGVAERLRLHNGYLLMPVLIGAAVTASGVELSAVPAWMTQFAQLMFGLILGARYERAFFARYRLFIPFAFLNAIFIMVAMAAVGVALSWAFGLSLATTVISTAPGGMAEMTIVAQSLQIGVPIVIAFHVFRVIAVNMATQHIYVFGQWLSRRLKRTAPQGESP